MLVWIFVGLVSCGYGLERTDRTRSEPSGIIALCPLTTELAWTNTEEVAYNVFPGVLKDVAKLIPDLIDRPFNTVLINGMTMDNFPFYTKIEEVNLIEIVDGSATNTVYRRPPRLKGSLVPDGAKRMEGIKQRKCKQCQR
jgi:hypothetical protein